MKKKMDQKKIVEKGSKTLAEFKEFISKGDVVDLAVGVIIGSAFGKIVTSIVNEDGFNGSRTTTSSPSAAISS